MLSTIHPTWKPLFDKWYSQIQTIFADVYNPHKDKITFPPQEMVFNAFEIDITKINICIIGQDCYHGDKQAMGLAFSVPKTVKIPQSLINIFKELQIEFTDRNYNFTHGDLTKWMRNENIFLLNCALTVEKSKPLSHILQWSSFTDDIIKFVASNNKKCIFLLLGNYAKDKQKIINDNVNDIKSKYNRCILGVHPSPLSAHKGFFNSNIFINIEKKLGYTINWQN